MRAAPGWGSLRLWVWTRCSRIVWLALAGAGIVNVPVFAVGVAVLVTLNTTVQTRDSAAVRSAPEDGLGQCAAGRRLASDNASAGAAETARAVEAEMA